MKLSISPQKIVSIYPYIACIRGNQIEIRDVLRDSLHNGSQLINLDGEIQYLSDQALSIQQAGLTLCDTSPKCQLLFLKFRTLKQIVQQLCDSQNLYLEALELCSSVKIKKHKRVIALLQDQVRVKYGIYLFNSGQYEEGLAQLSLSKRCNSVLFLKLIPNFVYDYDKLRNLPCVIPENEFPKVEMSQSQEDLEMVAGCLYPYLMSYRTRLISEEFYNTNRTSQNLDQQQENHSKQGTPRELSIQDGINYHRNSYDQENNYDDFDYSEFGDYNNGDNDSDSEDLNYSVNYLSNYIQQEDAGFLDMLPGWSQQQQQELQQLQQKQLQQQQQQQPSVKEVQNIRSPQKGQQQAQSQKIESQQQQLDIQSQQQQQQQNDLKGDSLIEAQKTQQQGVQGNLQEPTLDTDFNKQQNQQPIAQDDTPALVQDQHQNQSNREDENTKNTYQDRYQHSTQQEEDEQQQIEYQNPDQYLTHEQREQIITLLDTAVMKTLLCLPDTGSLLQFTQRSTYIDEQEGVKDLQEKGRYAELCSLFSHHRRHQEAMDILRKCSQDQASLKPLPTGASTDLKGMPGVWAAIRYLLKIDALDIKLIKEHLGWILDADPDAGILVFLNEQNKIPPQISIELLNQINKNSQDYVQQYLEEALMKGIAEPKVYDLQLAKIYISKALKFEVELGPPHKLMRQMQVQNQGDKSIKNLIESQNQQQQKGHKNLLIQDLLFPENGDSLKVEKDENKQTKPLKQEQIYIDLYFKLRQLIIASRNIPPENLLNSITQSNQQGQDSLLEIQALLLERLGLHHQALRIYVNSLQETKLAQQYCDRVYDALVKQEMEPQLQNSLLVSLHGFLFSKNQKDYIQLQPQEHQSFSTQQDTIDDQKINGQKGPQSPYVSSNTSNNGISGVNNNSNHSKCNNSNNNKFILQQRSQQALPFQQLERFRNPEPGDIYLALLKQFLNGPAFQNLEPSQDKDNLTQNQIQEVSQEQQQYKLQQQKQVQQQQLQQQQKLQPQDIHPQSNQYIETKDHVKQDNLQIQIPPQDHTQQQFSQEHQQQQDLLLQQQQQQQQQLIFEKSGRQFQVIEQLCNMLRMRIDRINVMKALYILPEHLPYNLIQPFIDSALTRYMQIQNNASVIRQLRKTKDFQIIEKLSHEKERFSLIGPENACHLCHKKLIPAHQSTMQNTRIAIFPNQQLAHNACYMKQQKQRGHFTSSYGNQ